MLCSSKCSITNFVWLNIRSFHVRSSFEHNRSNVVVNEFKVCPAVRRPKTTTTIVIFEEIETKIFHWWLPEIEEENKNKNSFEYKPFEGVVFGQHCPCRPIDEYVLFLFVECRWFILGLDIHNNKDNVRSTWSTWWSICICIYNNLQRSTIVNRVCCC